MPVYAIDKPLHLSSHDVVSTARRVWGTRRVGHAGTLDPLAAGVLVLLTEEETKLSPFLSGSRKRYLAWISFGATTPTLDAEGPLVTEPQTTDVDEEAVRQALPPFLEVREQVPPQYSAIKRGGVKGYEAARRGEELELPARPAGFSAVTLLAFAASQSDLPTHFARTGDGWRPDANGRPLPLPRPLGSFPTALVDVEVQAGTYVRAFARDLGAALGTPAFLSGLVRTSAGRVDLEQCAPFERLSEAQALGPGMALPYPAVNLSADEARRVRMGQRLAPTFRGRASLLDSDGELVAVAEESGGRMRLLRVWQGR